MALRGVIRRFGDVTALDHVDLQVDAGEFFALLGPSGCGKTTLLRILAGLDWPDAGTVQIDGQDALALPAHRRPVNTVFQSYALFPHLSVRDNVSFGLRMKRTPAPEVLRRTDAALALAQIAPLADRRPHQISGGQKQRVALARALVNEPRVLLLDEPLGALDLQLRRQLRDDLKALQRRLGITFIHVTHDQEEALALSDRLAVLRAGRLEQIGTPRALYEQPRTRFVAGFLGACNLIEARRTRPGPARLITLDSCFGPLQLPADRRLPDRDTVTLGIRPERIVVGPPTPPAAPAPPANTCTVTVLETLFAGPETRLTVGCSGGSLTVRLPNTGPGCGTPSPGDTLRLQLPPDALIPLED